jgi:hypothetical protein
MLAWAAATAGGLNIYCELPNWIGVFAMIPHPAEPAGLMEPSAELQTRTFAYQQILAYYRGDLADPQASANVEDQLRCDRRWQAHGESIRYLDLERAAAIQDAADLTIFSADQASSFCRAAAASCGRIFDEMLHEKQEADVQQRQVWNNHTENCVYCRRMLRLAHARQQQQEAGLPAHELLLRDWLLQPCYMEALRDATRRLGFEWQPHLPDSGDTILHLDTVVQNPPPPASPQS